MTNLEIPLPVTTIGGYLGSGKTTLVNHLLRNANGLHLAVLVNEFGELAIDEDLIEVKSDDIISIAGGCICCSFGNDLTSALIDLGKMTPRPDHIVIESSGVSIPGAIVNTLSLLEGFQSNGIVVLADADSVMANANDKYVGDTITRQLADAEILILNKLDLVGVTERTGLENWLLEMAPGAVLIPAKHCQVTPDAVLGGVLSPGKGSPGNHADELFDSIVLEPVVGVNVENLARELASGPYGVVRAKGFVADHDGKRKLLHIVANRWHVSDVSNDVASAIICLGFRGQLDKKALGKCLGSTIPG
ncbi:MAG: GTP-binding protein [Hyphomicrobiales bacterium]|nr:GTP-binding protein [Hyphomicrobiales bacterium]